MAEVNLPPTRPESRLEFISSAFFVLSWLAAIAAACAVFSLMRGGSATWTVLADCVLCALACGAISAIAAGVDRTEWALFRIAEQLHREKA